MLTFPGGCRRKILSRALSTGIGIWGMLLGGRRHRVIASNILTKRVEFEGCNESQYGAAEVAEDLSAPSPWETDQHKSIKCSIAF